MNKKVVILHPAYWEQAMGGAELQISYLANELVKQGYDVHFIYEDNGKKIDNLLNIKLHPLKKIKLRKWFGQRWFLYRNKIHIKLKKIKPDVIYSRFYSSWSGFAADFAYKNKCKHIWAVASDNDICIQNQKISVFRPFDIIENKYMKEVFLKTTYILTQNNFQQTTLQDLHNRKGIKIGQMTENIDEEIIKKNDETIKILWIANLKPLKRPELFVELVNQYCNATGIEFIMIGRCNEKYSSIINNCYKTCNNFKYLGEISNDEVNNELLKSHILVNTSKYEGFSNTFLQAWMRKVVVLSMNSNPDEILTKQELGFLCNTTNILKEKIDYLISNPNVRNDMTERAFHYAIKYHSLENNINKITSLF